jgi:hypothetical protein
MSANTLNFDPNSRVVKSASEIKRDKDQLYAKSFGDLDHDTIYRDPVGWKTPGGFGENVVELQKARWDQFKNDPVFPDGSSILGKWNELQRKGFDLQETTREIRKNLDTGDWTLPLDIIPQVFTVNPERLPMADMMTRVTTQDDEVVPTPLTDHPEFEFGLETTNDTEGSYSYKDATYDGDLSFDVLGMGAATRLEDKLILASSNLRNSESTQEQAFMRGAQQTLERQIIRGTDYNASGFDGFNDLISSGEGDTVTDIGDPDSASPSDYEDATRDIINESEFQGANRDSLAVVTDFHWHQELRKSLDDNVRYEPMADVFGVSSTLEFDGVPVFKSHAIPRADTQADGSTYNQAYTVNMEATYLSVLQELQVKPLAKVAPQEQTAFDWYGCLTSEENGAHIQAATVSPVA